MIQIPVTSDAYRKPINKQLYINHLVTGHSYIE